MSTAMIDIPKGYRPLQNRSEFTDLCGPLFEKIENGRRSELAIRIEKKHGNLRGITHGGLLMTLADTALGDAIVQSYSMPVGLVTVSLNTDFMKSAKIGEWVTARVSIQKTGKRLAFADCTLFVGDQKILRASGVFAVMERQAGR